MLPISRPQVRNLPHVADGATVTTTIFIANLHCPSCVEGIQESLCALDPTPEFVSYSIVLHSIVLRHTASLALNTIVSSLEAAGFEIHSVFQNCKAANAAIEVRRPEECTPEWKSSLEHAVMKWFQSGLPRGSGGDFLRRERHVEKCEQCKAEGGIPLSLLELNDLPPTMSELAITTEKLSIDETFSDAFKSPIVETISVVDSAIPLEVCKAIIGIVGMTCSACVGCISHAVEQLPFVRSIDINLLTHSGVAVFEGRHRVKEIIEAIEDAGFDASVEDLQELPQPTSSSNVAPAKIPDRWRASYAIGGMTCSVCSGAITDALRAHDWVEEVNINLVSNSGTIVFVRKDRLAEITETIEDIGYDAKLDNVVAEEASAVLPVERTVSIRVDGLFCHHCPENILNALRTAYASHDTFEVDGQFLSRSPSVLTVKYIPELPMLTIRSIFQTITDLNPAFVPSVFHPPTIEERAREMRLQERRKVLFRLVLSVLAAIPAFVLGIVFMSLVNSKNPVRRYLMQPMWVGNATRLSWSMFILSTPVYFFAADTFHRRAIKEVKSIWRPGSRTPYLHRFLRFGSMNMLMSLGTSIAYLASVVELALAAAKQSKGSMTDSYFDAVIFLTMFILIGRFLEAYSKAKTGDAVTSLGNLRPNEAVLVDPIHGDVKIATDLLEIGDMVRVHHGTSPPFDGIVLESTTVFDESSLTGESRPVAKVHNDMVFSGTVNKGSPIKIKITSIAGTSMLDQIINAVREGQTRRAPVERVADTITSHFVPFVVLVAILTWVIWLSLGMTGGIPSNWKNKSSGGWALWSLRFAIAVFVIACPCGIGLAAPTALFVGGGLAAKHGILVKGGGEAFQEASSLNCVVFDKTGTLTQGGDPAVTGHQITSSEDRSLILGLVQALEENSAHPIAKALVAFCAKQTSSVPTAIAVDEIPGKGLKATFDMGSREITVVIGNEALMSDYQVKISMENASILRSWKIKGESVALAAISVKNISKEAEVPAVWQLACMFAIADALRPEAVRVISQLKQRGIDVWMLSGDNPITAGAVGAQVGIPSTNIIAGVLPDQKAEKIRYLQSTLTKPSRKRLLSLPFVTPAVTPERATVAMVGDGINDAPALSTADLSIAIGSGSDIALSSSSFILINSHLSSLLTLLDLSNIVFRRVYFNFGWALVYNIIAMPIAAGVLYPITTGVKKMDMHHDGVAMEGGMGMGDDGDGHIRLDPVWASLAMALSSVSVVCSSLALRSSVPGLGFRARQETWDEAEDEETP